MNESARIFCPAKLNLYLNVAGKRADGFHEVRTVMQAIDLFDEITVEDAGEGIVVQCDTPSIPVDSGNLCWRAADAVRRIAGVKRGVRIKLRKKIPVAAGLGGGSSDAAGVLTALDRIWGLGLSQEMMECIGAGLGSDVPFFIRGGTALCTGRGEEIADIRGAAPFAYVLVSPGLEVSTPDVYASIEKEIGAPPVDERDCIAALLLGDAARIGKALYNGLEMNSLPYMEEVRRLKSLLIRKGAMGASMSGSGPSVFGITGCLEEAGKIEDRIRGELMPGTFIKRGKSIGRGSGSEGIEEDS